MNEAKTNSDESVSSVASLFLIISLLGQLVKNGFLTRMQGIETIKVCRVLVREYSNLNLGDAESVASLDKTFEAVDHVFSWLLDQNNIS